MIEFTRDEWFAEGKRRFGDDFKEWLFVCPACGNVQAIKDFEAFKDQGANPDSARLVCIGRFRGANKNAGLDGTGNRKGPCNYTSGGLLKLNPVRIKTEEGFVTAFAFAETTKKERKNRGTRKNA